MFTAPDGYNPKTGHGQVIFGFDDSKGPNGAFLVQNSFGPGWNSGPASDPGRNGRIWWDYDAFFAGQNYAAIALPTAPASVVTLGQGATMLRPTTPTRRTSPLRSRRCTAQTARITLVFAPAGIRRAYDQ